MKKIFYSSVLAFLFLLFFPYNKSYTDQVYIPPPEVKHIEIYKSSIYLCVQLIPQSQNIIVDNQYDKNNVKCPDGSIFADMGESSLWLSSIMIDKNNVEHKGIFKNIEDCVNLSRIQTTKLFMANPIVGFNAIIVCEKKQLEVYDTKLYDSRVTPFRNT